MKNFTIILLGPASALSVISTATAADLPTRKAAPVEYVRICDAYGAGFFYLPGTDTCLRVGGLVVADVATQNTPFRFNLTTGQALTNNNVGALSYAGIPIATSGSGYVNPTGRDAVSMLALGRIELDARNQTAYGTLRTFIRVDSVFGSGATANTGALSSGPLAGLVVPAGQGTGAGRETTILNKGFVQFAGLTAGRAQSFYDFYADALGYTALRGSNQTVDMFGYTYAGAGGFSGSLSIEDQVSHRAGVSSVVNLTGLPVAGGFVAGGPGAAVLAGTRVPDIVGNLRVDQPWGAAQLSAAAHQVRASLDTLGGVFPAQQVFQNSSSFGFAVQGGVRFDLNMIAAGDKLFLQAGYARGAVGYVTGNNFNYTNGVNESTNYGIGLGRISSGNNFNGPSDVDCVYTWSGSCDKSSAYAVTTAFKHFWTPTVSSSLVGSFMSIAYSNNATNPMPGAIAAGGTLAANGGAGITNYREFIIAPGIQWAPIKNFEIGAEFAWQHSITSRPEGLAPDPILALAGLPTFRSGGDLYRGRVRILRAF